MQVAAMDDVVFGAVAPFEIAEWQTVANLVLAPITPAQSRRFGRDGVELFSEPDGVEEPDGVGTDIDAGPKLGEFRRLFVDLRFKTLPAQRDGRCQSSKARSNDGNAAHFPHQTFLQG